MPTKDDPKGGPPASKFPKPAEPQARPIPKPATAAATGTANAAEAEGAKEGAKTGPEAKVVSQKASEPVVVSTPRAADPVVVSTARPAEASASTSQRPRFAFVDPTLQAVDALDCEALAIGVTSDVRPLAGLAGVVDWRLCGRLSDLLRRGVVTGALREKVLVPTLGMIPAKRIFLFGFGPRATLLDGATEKFAWMVDVLLKAKVEKVAVALPEPAGLLLGLVDEHVRKPLGDKCGAVYAPDPMMPADKDTRPIAAPSFTGGAPGT